VGISRKLLTLPQFVRNSSWVPYAFFGLIERTQTTGAECADLPTGMKAIGAAEMKRLQ
jgi:hypothetical protein